MDEAMAWAVVIGAAVLLVVVPLTPYRGERRDSG